VKFAITPHAILRAKVKKLKTIAVYKNNLAAKFHAVERPNVNL
jgi:hypothetical protein